jgi:hypothetical protein
MVSAKSTRADKRIQPGKEEQSTCSLDNMLMPRTEAGRRYGQRIGSQADNQAACQTLVDSSDQMGKEFPPETPADNTCRLYRLQG